ncbi:hypothetical protein N4G70_09760 [Streptomyces sp. ASQP_92]|uniref:hypothetical protein n=1 Tax=Streptomyces sp. ASQP_92 TaxID=2979116 RepID=UPI0021C06F38|nr:hypothetical protein [Streptomyces sp. ASQP_92]MCT9089154.1 hypothetical protein [Streptomyces sp. ASQP_92]
MVFGRKAEAEPPSFAPVHWDTVSKFTIGAASRPAAVRGAGPGPLAVRVEKRAGGATYLVPSVFVALTGSGEPAAASGFRLYEDEAGLRLLCSVTPDAEADKDGGRRHRVQDGRGREIGSVVRGPVAKRAVQHAWWLEQPDHPEVVARRHWAKGSAGQVLGRTVGKALGSVVGSVVGLGGDDSNTTRGTAKPVTWTSGEQVAMTSAPTEGRTWYLAQASWLDRRLAFALAVLREC